jgi:hypothetical protein
MAPAGWVSNTRSALRASARDFDQSPIKKAQMARESVVKPPA